MDLRSIKNAILQVINGGISWRMLPRNPTARRVVCLTIDSQSLQTYTTPHPVPRVSFGPHFPGHVTPYWQSHDRILLITL